MTRTPLSRSKGQRSRSPGHFTHRAAFTHQAAAAVAVVTYSPWEPTATLPSADSAARGASAPTEGGEGLVHIVAAARLQLVTSVLVMTSRKKCGKVALQTSRTGRDETRP